MRRVNCKNGAVTFRCRSRDFVLVGVLGTVESKIAAKKTHKMEKSAEKKSADFHFNGYLLALPSEALTINFLVSFVRR